MRNAFNNLSPRQLITLGALLLLLSVLIFPSITSQTRTRAGIFDTSSVQFDSYQSSGWEIEWLSKSNDFATSPDLICKTMSLATSNVRKWANCGHEKTNLLDSKVFSHFKWKGSCFKGGSYLAPIEPIVGHFRHPLALAQCVPPGLSAVDIQDRGYVVFGGMDTETFQCIYPGKKYLFDLGTQGYATSLGYLITEYRKLGIDFDEIWAWEVATIVPEEYWKVGMEGYDF